MRPLPKGTWPFCVYTMAKAIIIIWVPAGTVGDGIQVLKETLIESLPDHKVIVVTGATSSTHVTVISADPAQSPMNLVL